MRLLLDTHVVLWWYLDAEQLGKKCRNLIKTADSVYVSVICFWEIADKSRKGKIEPINDSDIFLIENDFLPLPITLQHASVYRDMNACHGDPFDRMLAAQAMAENMTLISADRNMPLYPVQLIHPGQ